MRITRTQLRRIIKEELTHVTGRRPIREMHGMRHAPSPIDQAVAEIESIYGADSDELAYNLSSLEEELPTATREDGMVDAALIRRRPARLMLISLAAALGPLTPDQVVDDGNETLVSARYADAVLSALRAVLPSPEDY